MRTLDDIIERVRAEFSEMPGMQLTAAQVQRLCGIEGRACQQVLKALVESKFLCVHPDGHYTRLTTGHHSRLATAVLRADTRGQKAS